MYTLPESKARTRLAQNLQALRISKEVTTYRAAKDMGFHPSYLSSLEKAQPPKNPSLETLDKIANYYNVDVYELFL